MSTVQLSKQHTEVWDEDGFEQVKVHPQEVWWRWVNSMDGSDVTHEQDGASATAAVAAASQPAPTVLAFNRFGPLKDQVGHLC